MHGLILSCGKVRNDASALWVTYISNPTHVKCMMEKLIIETIA